MSAIEIVGGVILLVVSAVIIALTLMQHTHGQGLSGAINGSALWCQQHPSDPCRPDAGKSDPHRRHRLLRGGHSGLCVRQPAGLSTALQPRMTTGLFFCLEGRAPARWRRPLWKC